jgi:recombination protein U
MNEGKQFEKDFKDSISDDIYFLRLHDSATDWESVKNGTQSRTMFTPKNPCDFIIYKYPNMYMFEFKSGKSGRFSFDEKIIKANQIEQLEKASKHKGMVAGFIFNFRDVQETYFVDINKFIEFKNTSGKKSLNLKDCQGIGIKVKQELKKVHYKYDVKTLLESLVK